MKNLFSKISALMFILLTVFVSGAQADRVDFLVNDDASRTEQNYPRVAVAGDGSFLLVWSDKRSGAQDIYLQRFDNDGGAIGANQKINDDSDQWTFQAEPAIAGDISGRYSTVWKDYRNGSYPFDPAIFFQRFDSSISGIGNNRDLTATSPDSLKESPDISLSPWGGGVVVWADYRNHNWDIYGQLIASTGLPIGNDFKINSDVGSAQQHAPKVSVSPDGWFVVVWYDNRNGNDDIEAQLFDSLGNRMGGNILVGSDLDGARQAFPDVAADGTGHFTVVWVDWSNGNYPHNPDIYYRKFDTSAVPVNNARMINPNGNVTAQREVAIGIDRRGHTAIVWADSNSSSWDIIGQMIDVDGRPHQGNFEANSSADSAQMHPDVAVDGRRRYVVWADKRNGHFDIYASITTYNEPQLIPSPSSLNFSMDVDGSMPTAQTVRVSHAGYNSLQFETILSHDWLTVTPSSGQTEADISVTINTDTLSFGTYLGSITLVDLGNSDSSVIIAVRLDVTAPLMELSADTVRLRSFSGIDETQSAALTIQNSGTGIFDWTASEAADWLTLSDQSGSSDMTISLFCNALSLAAGNYEASLIFTAPESFQETDTVLVLLEVIDDQPYLKLSSDSIYAYTESPGVLEYQITVSNIGIGQLLWNATTITEWLSIDPISGSDNDQFIITVNSNNLLNGIYTGMIEVSDSASFSITEQLPIVLDLFIPPPDTLWISSMNIELGQSGIVPIELWSNSEIISLTLPLKYDPTAFEIDSFVIASNLEPILNYTVENSFASGLLTIRLASLPADTFITAGHQLLGELFLSAGMSDITSSIDSALTASLSMNLTTSEDQLLIPMLQPAEIIIGNPTSVDIVENIPLPNQITLHQNYPNPFNNTTVIRFDLPQADHVRLDIFNILGQRIARLIDRYTPAGSYQIDFEGKYDSGRRAPTGVYFYRLEAAGVSRVRKLVLLK